MYVTPQGQGTYAVHAMGSPPREGAMVTVEPDGCDLCLSQPCSHVKEAKVYLQENDPEEDRLIHTIQEIQQGHGHYGEVPIQTRRIGRWAYAEVYLIGNPGITASVGQMIRKINEEWGKGQAISVPVFRWVIPEGPGNSYFYGVEIVDPNNRASRTLYIVGGCTDYSGEGGRGHLIMETYLKRFDAVETKGPGQLIDVLFGSG